MTFRVTRYQVTNQCPVWRARGREPPPEGSERTRGRTAMARKALRVLLPVSVAVLVASQWREISRYLKISQMSRGDGHPQAVPAGGKHAYKGSGAADGTGDFDSESRGGGPSSG